MFNYIQKYLFLKRTKLSEGSHLVLNSKVHLYSHSSSEILIRNGSFKLVKNLPQTIHIPHLERSVISLGKNSKLIINGNVLIASGTLIDIRDNATLSFDGNNIISHNNTIICSHKITIGEGSSTGVSATLMDHDSHAIFHKESTKPLTVPAKPLIIGKNVGILMNSQVVAGCNIGNNSSILAGTTIRDDIPASTMVYNNSNILKFKKGYSYVPFK